MVSEFEQFNFEKHNSPEAIERITAYYRSLVAKSLDLAKGFRGVEEQIEQICARVLELERFVALLVRGKTRAVLSLTEELRLGDTLLGKEFEKSMTTDGILGVAVDQLEQHFEAVLNNVFALTLPGVILPHAKTEVDLPKAHRADKVAPVEPEQRLKPIIGVLFRHGIFVDDMVLCRGEVQMSSFRKTSYILVEIPRISRSILVCNELGEATFVTRGILPRTELTTKTKEDLQQQFPSNVVKIEKKNETDWLKEIEIALFKELDDSPTTLRTKVNVVLSEEFRTEILKELPTSQDWLKLSYNDLAKVKIKGKKIAAIATIFGVSGNPLDHNLYMLELGLAIYGENSCLRGAYNDAVVVKNALGGDQKAMDFVRSAALAVAQSADKWLALDQLGRQTFKVLGVGAITIAKILGVTTRAKLGSLLHHYALGKALFPTSTVIAGLFDRVQRREDAEVGNLEAREQLKVIFRKEHPDIRQLMYLGAIYRRAIIADGMTLTFWQKLLAVQGHPLSENWAYYELLQQIYGLEDPAFRRLYRDELNRIRAQAGDKAAQRHLANHVRRKYRLQYLLNMPLDTKIDVRGMRMKALATNLGMDNDFLYKNKAARIPLLQKVFGNRYPQLVTVVESRSAADRAVDATNILAGFFEKCPTAETFLKLSQPERKKFKIGGRSFHGLATLLGLQLEASPSSNNKAFIMLAERVYGPEAVAAALLVSPLRILAKNRQ